jgi:hypothetical protein
MGRSKGMNKAMPEIPYSGALKKLFEPIEDANFSLSALELTGSGKKYRIQSGVAIRQWSLKVIKSGTAIVVVPTIDGHFPPEIEPAFAACPSLVVQEIKITGKFIVLWVFNSSGSSANIVFKDGEDAFICDPLINSLDDLRSRIEEIIPVAHLVEGVLGLHGAYPIIATILQKFLAQVGEVSTALMKVPEKTTRPSSRRGKVVEPAPSRGDIAQEAETALLVKQCRTSDPIRTSTAMSKGVSTGQVPEIIIEIPGSQSDPSTPSNAGDEFLDIATRPGGLQRCLSRDYNGPPSTIEEIVIDATVPIAHAVQEMVVCQNKPSKKVSVRVPQTTLKRGAQYNSKEGAYELQQFEQRMDSMYPFGKAKHKKIDVENMEMAPTDYKYRPFHSRLRDVIVGRLLTALNVSKQTFTLMPKTVIKPTNFDRMVAGKFYIINGTHTYAAVKVILDDPNVSTVRKDILRKWNCDFVWSSDVKDLSHISVRCNADNRFQWEEPEYLLHLQFVRDIWVGLDRPVKAVIGKRSQIISVRVDRWKVSQFLFEISV